VTTRPRLLVLCPDPVGQQMRGMAIRYTELARALAPHADVTLAATGGDGAEAVWSQDRLGPLRNLLRGADAVLAPPQPPHVTRALERSGARLCFDLYDPESLEVLERFRHQRLAARRVHAATATDKLLDALRSGHFFVCADERQRDLWIGALLAGGLLGPAVYDRDPTLRSLIDVLPFGVPAEPPARTANAPIRARFPELSGEERIVLWNGGLWRWLDAPAAIRAVATVRERGTPARLVVMGASSAGGASTGEREARQASELASSAALFNDRWVPYEERGAWLLEADCAISAHRDHLESRYAFRTRVLDCLWAGLPPVVTAGDALAARVEREHLGASAPPGDDVALADALERVLAAGRDSYAVRLAAAAQRFTWPRVAEPLVRFVTAPEVPPRMGAGGLGALEVSPGQRLRRTAQRLTRGARLLRDRRD
jgi:glycosyltransferase involved in cell wall biosynthesis